MNPVRIVGVLGAVVAAGLGAVFGWRSECRYLDRDRLAAQDTDEFVPVKASMTIYTSTGPEEWERPA